MPRADRAASYTLQDRGGAPARFVLRSRIARGGYSDTFLAEGAGGEEVVIKLPRADRPSAESNLKVERRILRQVSHPNLVRLLASGESPLAIACERLWPNPCLLLSQPSNRARLPSDPGTRYYPLPPTVALSLGVDLFRALEALHSAGFVHHDVKLENLLVRAPGGVSSDRALLAQVLAGRASGVLIDLGGSRSLAYLEELRRGETDARVVPPQLSPLWAPPELLTPEGLLEHLGPHVDVYAAGLLLNAMLSGEGPYDHARPGESPVARVVELKREEAEGSLLPVSYDAIAAAPGCGAIAGELFGFLSTCFQRRPEARPSAREGRRFLEALAATLARINRG